MLAQTTDDESTSVYAFTHSNAAGRVDVVALNKSNAPLTVTIEIASAPALTKAVAYALGGSKVGLVAVSPAPSVTCSAGTCKVSATLPSLSATTLALQ